MERKGKCKRCGKCCETITIFTSKKMIKLIWLRKLLMSYSFKHYRYIGIDEVGDMLFECKYLKNKKCTEYKKRPLTCSQYPTQRTYLHNHMITDCGYYFEDSE